MNRSRGFALGAWLLGAAALPAASTTPDTLAALSPATLEVCFEPGGVTAHLTVTNCSPSPATYSLRSGRAERVTGKAPTFGPSAGRDELVTTFAPAQFTLQGGENQVVTATIRGQDEVVRAGRFRIWATLDSSEAGARHARCELDCTVPPMVAVAAADPIVEAGAVRRGPLAALGHFIVEANTDAVQLQIAATDLYLDDDTNVPGKTPIPLNTAKGVQLTATVAGAVQAPLALSEAGTRIGRFPATSTRVYELTGHDPHGVRDHVYVGLEWTQNTPMKPIGTYTGLIRVTALVLPEP